MRGTAKTAQIRAAAAGSDGEATGGGSLVAAGTGEGDDGGRGDVDSDRDGVRAGGVLLLLLGASAAGLEMAAGMEVAARLATEAGSGGEASIGGRIQALDFAADLAPTASPGRLGAVVAAGGGRDGSGELGDGVGAAALAVMAVCNNCC
uniref:Uncharacterized protein n=1 Tax=Oryza meridionalis TaxID=40149 RepID=A0A0E0DXI6_9ORYZ